MCASISIILHIKYIFSIIRRFKQIKMLHDQKRGQPNLRKSFSLDDHQEMSEPVKESELLVNSCGLYNFCYRNNPTRRLRRRMTSIYMVRRSSSSLVYRTMKMRLWKVANIVAGLLSHFRALALLIARMTGKITKLVQPRMDRTGSNNSRQ